MNIAITAILIFLFWFLLSGHTEPLLIGLGIFSTFITMFLSRRMNLIDQESYRFYLSLRLLRYYIFLGKEILIANIDVMKRIFAVDTIDPQIENIPVKKQTNISKVTYANSITLTPGTVTMELNDDHIKVYSLTREALEDLKTGRMADRVPDNEDIV
jgi:multicomponent Na+:H+ antiporter subunit E